MGARRPARGGRAALAHRTPPGSRGGGTMSAESPLLGGCGCGAVRFEISEPPLDAIYCHCTRCQRRTGTAASANAVTAPGSFRVVQGEEHLRAWRPDDGAEKWFCGLCGAALFSRTPGEPPRIGVRLGA